MTTTLFRAWTRRARRYLATRRLLRLYRDVSRLVDLLGAQAECPSNWTALRRKVIRLRDTGFIGYDTSKKLNRLTTMTRKASAGEVKLGELLDLVRCAKKMRRILTNTERRLRPSIPITFLAGRLGVSAEWIEQNWIQREVDPLPSFRWCDGCRFVNLDKLRDWQSTPAPAGGTAKGGAA